MNLLTVKPTALDETIPREVSFHTGRSVERVAGVATWGADEHVLLGLAAVGWLLTRSAPKVERQLGNHFLICSVTTTILPHIMKRFINQERPDRLTVEGHLRGIPCPANPKMRSHRVMLCMWVHWLRRRPCCRRRYRNATGVGAALVMTRVVLLAHWFTDVLAGLALG